MKKKELEKLIIMAMTLTLSTVNAIEVKAEVDYLKDTQKALVCNLQRGDIQIVKDIKIREIEEKANIIKAEREEAERLRLLEEEEERLRVIEESKVLEIARKNSVSVNLDNVLEPSNINADELYEVFMLLDKPEMAALSNIITETEAITGINSFVIAGAVANESAWGTSSRAIYDGNYTGYGVYNDYSTGINHGDAYSNIVNTFIDVKENYLTEGGSYFYGYSTYHINISYSASSNWRIVVNDIAKTLESYYNQFIKEV